MLREASGSIDCWREVSALKGDDSTIIIPVLNESGAIRGVLASLDRTVPAAKVLVVDDCSADGTQDVVGQWALDHPNVRLIERTSDRGLTASVLAGLANVTTSNVLVMDGDGQHPVEMVPRLLDSLGGSTISVAVRSSTAGLRGGRKLMTRAGNALAGFGSRRQGGASCSDMLSGLFAVRASHFKKVVETNGREFERPGFKVLLDLLRFSPPSVRISEVPFELSAREGGSSKLRSAQMASFLRQLGPMGRFLAPALTSRFIRFCAVGASGVLVNSAIFLTLLLLGLPPLVSAGLSAEGALLWNFSINDVWTWQKKGDRFPVRLGRYHVVGIAGIAINLVVLAVLVRFMDPLPANLLGILAAVISGYFANDRWTWAAKGQPRPPLGTDRAALYMLSLVVQCVLAALFIHDWDGFVFGKTVSDFVQNGVSPYQTAVSAPPYIFNAYDVPPVPEWYAYPPLPLLLISPMYAAGLLVPAVPAALLRLLLKVPFIAGNLLLARAGGRMVGENGKMGKTELFLLFNPFLIFIGAAWGMTDSLMVLFMVWSLLLMRGKRPALAGAAFGAAALIKLFPLFFLPAALLWARRKGGPAAVWRYMAGGAAVVAAVCLPFLLQSPEGFIRQVLLVHLQRPPQGISLVGLPYYLNYLNDLLGLSLPAFSLRDVSLLSIGLLAPSLMLGYIVAYRARKEPDILLAFAGIAFALMLFNKVVNEQYLVLPLVLSVLYGARSDAPQGLARLARRTAVALTAGGLIAGVVIGFHFLTLIPPDTAALGISLFGNFPVLEGSLLNQRLLFIVPAVIAAIAVAPAWLLMMDGMSEVARQGFRALLASARRSMGTLSLGKGIGSTGALLSVLLLLFPGVGGAFLLPSERTLAHADLPPLKDPVVGTYYYLWWNNPTHDPEMREGNWKDVSQAPSEGYYTSSPAYMIQDIRQMKAAGIDVAIVSYHGYDSQQLLAFARVCRMEGFRFAVMMEVGAESVRSGTQDIGYPLDSRSREGILAMAAAIPGEVWKSPYFFRHDGRPVVLAYDAFFAIAPRQHTQDVNKTFAGFWFSIRQSLEARHGPLFLVAGLTGEPSPVNPAPSLVTAAPFDSLFLYSPAFAWAAHKKEPTADNLARWDGRERNMTELDIEAGLPIILSVMPSYDDTVLRGNGFTIPSFVEGRPLYDLLWDRALARGPAIVAVTSWNEFFEGTAIEPSVQYGDLYLESTRRWSDIAKGEGLP